MNTSRNALIRDAQKLNRQIKKIYESSRIVQLNRSGRLLRALNRSSSDLIEEAVADWLAGRLARPGDRFLLGFGVHLGERLRRFDILWESCGIVRHVFEIKTDMGWARNNSHDLLNQLCSNVRDIRRKPLKFVSSTDASGKEHKIEELSFSHAELHLIIISSVNSGKEWASIKPSVKAKRGVHIYRLFRTHPNHRKAQLEKPDGSDVNIGEFELLIRRLKKR